MRVEKILLVVLVFRGQNCPYERRKHPYPIGKQVKKGTILNSSLQEVHFSTI